MPIQVLDWIRKSRYSKNNSAFKNQGINEVFNTIFKTNHWKNEESISGPGSTHLATSSLRDELAIFIKDKNITSITDLPCGDFNWMKNVELENTIYHGCDIVQELIDNNIKKYQSDQIRFSKVDVIKDQIPKSDVLLVRDCLVHFSYEHIHAAVLNIINSNCEFLITTSFKGLTINYDIVTGDWRPINLEIAPFFFPKPIATIVEYCPEEYERQFREKVLGIWKISDLRNSNN